MDPQHIPDSILIVDFGSQVTQLIARRVREAGVYSEISPFSEAEKAFHRMKPKGIILSGSPASVCDDDSPRAPQVLMKAAEDLFALQKYDQAAAAAKSLPAAPAAAQPGLSAAPGKAETPALVSPAPADA